MDLCLPGIDLVALLTRNQRAYELGYFWGLGGTLQGLLTPPLYYDYPDLQFIFFFIQHGGVVAALLYLTLGLHMRPAWRSLPSCRRSPARRETPSE